MSFCASAQKDSLFSSKAYQAHLNEEFANKETSPLTDKDLKSFKSLDFFEINDKYRVEAKFVKTESAEPFMMSTTTDRQSLYVKYGEINFTLNNEEFKLNVYQSQRLLTDPKYKDYLFIPFTDLTNGETTYNGGRYLDFKIPNSTNVIIDFNKAYNPYCAYNGIYSCPIPPEENNLSIKIEAGVKQYKPHNNSETSKENIVK